MLTQHTIISIVRELNADQVRYLLVGGLAVIAHGYLRATSDLDIVLDLEPANARRALGCFERLGYRPRVPVPMSDFADPMKRRTWIETKDMVVFSLWKDDALGPIVIDLFITEPFPFADAWPQVLWQQHQDGTRFPIVDLPRLLAMKQAAGRPKDLLDIAELRRLHPGV